MLKLICQYAYAKSRMLTLTVTYAYAKIVHDIQKAPCGDFPDWLAIADFQPVYSTFTRLCLQ